MEDEKQLILAKDTLNDIDPIMGSYIDISIGKENTFLVKVARQKWRPEMTFGNVVYIKNTEYGGIIGEIVSMKEDTVTIETSKAGTKIRFLKTAIRSVDVRASEKNAPAPTETDSENK